MSHLLKNILIAFGVTVVIGVGYFFFMNNEPDPATGTPQLDSPALLQTAKVLSDTKKIDKFNFPVEILSDKRFTSLTNAESVVEAPDIPVGRPNPFEAVH